LKNSAEAATAALARSVAKKASLPLGNAPAAGESEGLTRLKGAFMAQVTVLKPDPDQPRRIFDDEQLQGLKRSILRRGIRQPIRVRRVDDGYIITSGERRYQAAKAAGLSEVPCIIDYGEASTREVLIDQVVENWQRADLQPVELHEALVKLRDVEGMTQEEIVEETGKSASEVSRFLSLAKVKKDILTEAKADKAGTFTRTTLEALAKVPHDEQERLAAEVRAGSLTSKEAEREATRIKKRLMGKRVGRGPGAVRHFVVGTALVEVKFRKKDATAEDVAAILRRAASMAERNEASDT
jgi:ParB family chromosome partitioning protein